MAASSNAVRDGQHLRRVPVKQKRRKPESGPLVPSTLSPTARLSAAAVPLAALGSPVSALLSAAADGAAGSGTAAGPSGAARPCEVCSDWHLTPARLYECTHRLLWLHWLNTYCSLWMELSVP